MTHRHTTKPFLLRLVVGLLCVLIASVPTLAWADPTTGPTNTDNEPALEVQVTRMQPSVGAPESTVAISGNITNITNGPLEQLSIRIQRDTRKSTRAELREVDLDAPSYDADVGQFSSIEGDLAPGGTMKFTITATVDDLGMQDAGIYPLLININGIDGGQLRRIGQAATMIPFFPEAPKSKVGVSWIWPLIDKPHRAVNQTRFIDDGLKAAVSVGGRLDRMLTLAERFGVASKMTLVVDPDLIDSLQVMTEGYEVAAPPVDGKAASTPGTGSVAAGKWLARLKALAQEVPVASLAYGDPDVVAMQRSGLGNEIEPARKAGAQIVDEVLDITSISTMDWPINGLLTDAARDVEVTAGVDTFVLGGAAFNQPAFLSSGDGVTESPGTTIPGTTATALTIDPTLSSIVAQGEGYAAGTSLATQRFSTELAAILGEAPSRQRNVLVAPPRRWSPPSGYAATLLAMSSKTSWLSPTSIQTIQAAPPVDRGPIAYPANLSVQEIARANLAPLQQALSDVNDLRSSMDQNDAAAVLGQYQRAIWCAASSANRLTPKTLVTRVQDINTGLATMRGSVQIIPPSDGTYTLSASDAPLVFTIENKLQVPMKFRIDVGGTTSGLTAEDVDIQEVPEQSKLTVTVPASVDKSGTFTIVAKIKTPDGQPLGKVDGQEIIVNSTAYGTVALVITFAAFAMLLLLVARRGYKRIKHRGSLLAPKPSEIPFDPDRPAPATAQQ